VKAKAKVRVSFRLSAGQHRKLVAVAKDEGLTLSELLRRRLESLVEKQAGQPRQEIDK
jgi:hypothetical protein